MINCMYNEMYCCTSTATFDAFQECSRYALHWDIIEYPDYKRCPWRSQGVHIYLSSTQCIFILHSSCAEGLYFSAVCKSEEEGQERRISGMLCVFISHIVLYTFVIPTLNIISAIRQLCSFTYCRW